MKRRRLLQLMLSAGAFVAGRLNLLARSQTPALTNIDVDRLRGLAHVVLPQELGVEGRLRAADAFLAWLRDYHPGADAEHGYGFPRLRKTPPSPASRYPAQLDALDREARKRGRSSFAETALNDQRTIVEAAIAGIDRLPSRPDGGHIATDLLGFVLNSIEGNDLCYRARIGRDTCRELAGSENQPAPLATGGR